MNKGLELQPGNGGSKRPPKKNICYEVSYKVIRKDKNGSIFIENKPDFKPRNSFGRFSPKAKSRKRRI